jgi:L-fuculose-phosphate aldolase
VSNLLTLKREIVEVGRRVYQRGYVASNDGNISARLDDKRVVITPTGVSKGFMTPEDLIVLDMEGKVVSGTKKPSSEMFMHLSVYKHRPDVMSVCHAHPPYATGFAVAGIPLDKCILPEVIIVLGGIPIVEYGTPGTSEFFKPVLKIIDKYDAFLLANHGALTIGKDVVNAYHKMETLEHFAHIAFVAQQLGHMNVLNTEQVRKLTDLRSKFGIRTNVGCETCEEEESCPSPDDATGSGKRANDDVIAQITDAVMQRLKKLT